MAETDRSGFPRRRRYFLLFFVSLREMQGVRITSLHLSQGRKKEPGNTGLKKYGEKRQRQTAETYQAGKVESPNRFSMNAFTFGW
jgi:hypothetical protein